MEAVGLSATTGESSKQSTKRKRVVLTIQQKVDILNALDEGTSAVAMQKKYLVGSSTIYDLKAHKDEIFKFYEHGGSNSDMARRKNIRPPKNRLVERFLCKWLHQCRAHGIVASGPVIVAKARFIHNQLGLQINCSYSAGWLNRFKMRNNHLMKPIDKDLNDSRQRSENIEGDISILTKEATLHRDGDTASSTVARPQDADTSTWDGCSSEKCGTSMQPQQAGGHASAIASHRCLDWTSDNSCTFMDCGDAPASPDRPGQKKDADELFFSSIASEIKRLPKMKQAHLKLKMMNLVIGAVKEYET